ncbi:MAG: FAD-dependent oxidoreductase [Actinobacteria bacterium]|nr:FAD-dependent oxidoreductase [Actinomycetota bacterium]
MTKYAIIGNSVAAVGAIEAIRSVDAEGSITVVANEPYHVYSRPLISEYLAGETTVERMAYRPADFYEKNGVEAILGVAAAGIDFDKKSIALEDGQSVEYDKLLLATGGKPFVPPIVGLDHQDIFTFTGLADAMKLDEAIDRVKDFVVIGGGLIGLKCAESLHKRGVKVTVVELADRVMAAVLDVDAGRIVEKSLARKGIDVVTGDTVEEILGEGGSITGVRLKSEKELPCQAVVIAIGVAPNVELVKDSPVKVGRGILVDDMMGTSVPDVYAAGDVAEGRDVLMGVTRILPIWPNAYMQGRAAGMAMTGSPRGFAGGLSMNSIELFGTPLINVGITDPRDESFEILTRSEGDHLYRKVVLRDGRLVGAIVVGEIDRAGILTGLIRDGVDVSDFKEELLRSDFGHIDLPADVRERRLFAL